MDGGRDQVDGQFESSHSLSELRRTETSEGQHAENAYNSELKKFLDRGAITKMSQEEIGSYTGPVSYVSHHGVHKPDSTTTPLRIVTNTSLKNGNCGMSPNECMQEGPNALASLIEVLVGFRMHEVALHYDMTRPIKASRQAKLKDT